MGILAASGEIRAYSRIVAARLLPHPILFPRLLNFVPETSPFGLVLASRWASGLLLCKDFHKVSNSSESSKDA